MALKLQLNRAGHYSATLLDGQTVEVEYHVTDYGDKGWFWWCDGERSDYPVATKRYATQRLEQHIERRQPHGQPLIDVIDVPATVMAERYIKAYDAACIGKVFEQITYDDQYRDQIVEIIKGCVKGCLYPDSHNPDHPPTMKFHCSDPRSGSHEGMEVTEVEMEEYMARNRRQSLSMSSTFHHWDTP